MILWVRINSHLFRLRGVYRIVACVVLLNVHRGAGSVSGGPACSPLGPVPARVTAAGSGRRAAGRARPLMKAARLLTLQAAGQSVRRGPGDGDLARPPDRRVRADPFLLRRCLSVISLSWLPGPNPCHSPDTSWPLLARGTNSVLKGQEHNESGYGRRAR